MTDTKHYADAAWDTDRIGIYTADDEQLTEGDLAWVDPDDDSTAADGERRNAITSALAALGWEPISGEEWQHIDGGLGSEAGAERVPVQPIAD